MSQIAKNAIGSRRQVHEAPTKLVSSWACKILAPLDRTAPFKIFTALVAPSMAFAQHAIKRILVLR